MSKKRANKKVTFDKFQNKGFIKLWLCEDSYYVVNRDGSCKYFYNCYEGEMHQDYVIDLMNLICEQFKFKLNTGYCEHSNGWEHGSDYSSFAIDLYYSNHYDFIVNVIKFLLENDYLEELDIVLSARLLDFNDNVIEIYDGDSDD